jgi:DNA-directed RNA polymerase specialized sigma24 family protein
VPIGRAERASVDERVGGGVQAIDAAAGGHGDDPAPFGLDLFRKKKPESFSDAAVADENDELLQLEDLLPSPDAGPEALYARNVLLDELASAVDELPEEQREVFVAHELEGRSFTEMAVETRVSVNTLLSRKR